MIDKYTAQKSIPGLFLMIISISTLLACKKDSSNSPIIGKWNAVKLRIYSRDASGALINDTTYSGATFEGEYVQFLSNGTEFNHSEYEYFAAGEGLPKTPQRYVSGGTLNYSAIDPQEYLLTQRGNLVNPGGFVTTDTAKLINSGSLLIHFTNYGHGTTNGSTTFDWYYTK